MQADGKIVVVGSTDIYDFAVARLNGDGSLDTSFDSDGKQTIGFGSNDENVDAGLKDALDNWTTAQNSSASKAAAGNLTVSATTNGGNYTFSDDFMTKLFFSAK